MAWGRGLMEGRLFRRQVDGEGASGPANAGRLASRVGGEPATGPADRIMADADARLPDAQAEDAEYSDPRGEARPFASEFVFVTDERGTIRSVSGVPREALVGHSMACVGTDRIGGFDQQTGEAFLRRLPVRDRGLMIVGSGPTAGAWRVWARPAFSEEGRFTGYEGAARRPQLRASWQEPAKPFPILAPEVARQLVHELRTPLNAIRGFSEMIEGEFLGPASVAARAVAGEIVQGATHLTEMIEDLDLAAAIENGTARLAMGARATDAAALAGRVIRDLASAGGPPAELAIAAHVSALAVPPEIAERLLRRLAAVSAGYAEVEEGVTITIDRDADHYAVISADRPSTVLDFDPRSLIAGHVQIPGSWPHGPLLGIGFALRLIACVAEAFGGRFDISGETYVLSLPTIATAQLSR
ncbi:histidine kinase dimerization/phospho-acceptor domain-containing protein [Sphingomonas sp. ID0503]|uniref:histidine kinase dimerization/phospho-acceptor domain-containing protein n=1 Tax=Sphingomonas sp. ID0503 TaxID=3399691 RepID=UPI003AFAE730